MVCSKCKKNIPDGSQFCPYCGYNLKSKKKNILAVIIALVIVGGLLFGINAIVQSNNKQNQKYGTERAKERLENNEKFEINANKQNEYKNNNEDDEYLKKKENENKQEQNKNTFNDTSKNNPDIEEKYFGVLKNEKIAIKEESIYPGTNINEIIANGFNGEKIEYIKYSLIDFDEDFENEMYVVIKINNLAVPLFFLLNEEDNDVYYFEISDKYIVKADGTILTFSGVNSSHYNKVSFSKEKIYFNPYAEMEISYYANGINEQYIINGYMVTKDEFDEFAKNFDEKPNPELIVFSKTD